MGAGRVLPLGELPSHPHGSTQLRPYLLGEMRLGKARLCYKVKTPAVHRICPAKSNIFFSFFSNQGILQAPPTKEKGLKRLSKPLGEPVESVRRAGRRPCSHRR